MKLGTVLEISGMPHSIRADIGMFITFTDKDGTTIRVESALICHLYEMIKYKSEQSKIPMEEFEKYID